MHLGFLSQDIIYGRRRTRQPQLPVWTNLSSLYGLLEFGNRSAAVPDYAAAHESVGCAYRIQWQDG
jgi:hypothetical protein